MTVFVEEGGLTFTLVESLVRRSDRDGLGRNPMADRVETGRGTAVRMRFGGGGTAREVTAEKRSAGVHNYYLGKDPARWRTGVPLHQELTMHNVWPRIDVRTRISDGHFEYDLIAAPGADLAGASFEVDGADGLRIDADGSLLIETPLGIVRQPKPTTWQIDDEGHRDSVVCNYVLTGTTGFRFSAPAWDRVRTLVIDPGLIWSTFVGGSALDNAAAVAVDPSGAAATAGLSNSGDYPTTAGAFDPSHNGAFDVFVSRVDSTGTSLVYSTFIGDTSTDGATGVAVDTTGAAYACGWTTSPGFPVTAGAYDTTFGSGDNGFVLNLDPNGALVYSTFVGSDMDPAGLGVDFSGAAVVVGSVFAASGLATTVGAFDTSFGSPGTGEGFALRLNASGTGAIYSTFLGGLNNDNAYAVSVASNGTATVAGRTGSSTFPTTPGAYDTSFNGNVDAFVTQLNPIGAAVFSTYLGGTGNDPAFAVAASAAGTVIAGWTTSGATFPATAGAYDTAQSGPTDAFVAKLNAAGTALVFATFLGGSGDDAAWTVGIDRAGNAVVAGYTDSGNFPTTPGAVGPSYVGFYDGWLARVSSNGAALTYSTYLGGSYDEECFGLALDASGMPTVCGYTQSPDFPTTAGSYQTTNYGITNAFASRIQLDALAYPLMAFPASQLVPVGGTWGFEVIGPPGAPLAVLIALSSTNIPAPPYGVIGLPIFSAIVFDGLGLGYPNSIPMVLNIPATGQFYFTLDSVPSLPGLTFWAQAASISGLLPAGGAVSTHGDLALPTPACETTIVP